MNLRGGFNTITNCIFSGNSANYAVDIRTEWASSTTITNCTFSGNNSNLSTRISNIYSTTTITNCILWGESGQETLYISSSSPHPTVSYCNIDKDGYEGIDGNIRQDPLLVGAGDYHLQPGSPCIDAGTSDGAPETDIEGNERDDDLCTPNTGGGAYPYYDMGAYEFKGDTDADGVGDVCDNCQQTSNGPDGGTCVKETSGIVIGTGVECTIGGGECGSGETCDTGQGDFNANDIGDVCECYANLDTDLEVGLFDLIIMKNEYGTSVCDPVSQETCCKGDIDGDGEVGLFDLIIMKNQYGGSGCPYLTPPCTFP